MADARQTSFALSIESFRETVQDNAGTVVRKLCLDMTSRIVQRSPVDTGRFRGNWYASLDMPNVQTTFDTDMGGAETIGRASAIIKGYDPMLEQDVWITNSLPYAEALEYGHSGQAPVGVVRVTVADFQTMLNNAMTGLK